MLHKRLAAGDNDALAVKASKMFSYLWKSIMRSPTSLRRIVYIITVTQTMAETEKHIADKARIL